jgi:hypothetical protein
MGECVPRELETKRSWSQGKQEHWRLGKLVPMFQGALGPTEIGTNVAWFQASHVSIELGTKLYWNMGVMIQNRQRVDQGRGDEGGTALSDLRFRVRR